MNQAKAHPKARASAARHVRQARRRHHSSPAPITLLLVPGLRADDGSLWDHLVDVVRRVGPRVELKIAAPGAAQPDQSRAPSESPMLWVLRGDEVVGQAMGSGLSARELESFVRYAVDWPHAA